jgi:hypothetical protein
MGASITPWMTWFVMIPGLEILSARSLVAAFQSRGLDHIGEHPVGALPDV